MCIRDSSESFLPAGASNQTEVFAVHGADPEVMAYAMAKYSRSSLSMRESLSEISAQRAEQLSLIHILFSLPAGSLKTATVFPAQRSSGSWPGCAPRAFHRNPRAAPSVRS